MARERRGYCSHPKYFQFRLFIATLTETNTIHKTGFETALFSELMTHRLMEICQFLPAGIWPDFAGKEKGTAKKPFGFLNVCDGCLLSLYSFCILFLFLDIVFIIDLYLIKMPALPKDSILGSPRNSL